ncbi:hypothetical protein ACMD2_16479 [Ananas comosus]|uniref:LysM domain-containing protein n=1 Tax=Ananas comosus TaxID=4615 RepID=A0A199VVU9_ANACO|nr:hypothetical protein ACMD2_16479 [Ananas comosus]
MSPPYPMNWRRQINVATILNALVATVLVATKKSPLNLREQGKEGGRQLGRGQPTIILDLTSHAPPLCLSTCASYIGVRKPPTLSCNAVYGVRSGDTCFAIAQQFNLTIGSFSDINPNLDCDKLFVGQWLCINGVLV